VTFSPEKGKTPRVVRQLADEAGRILVETRGVKRLNPYSGARTSPAVGGVKSSSLEAAE